MAMWEGHTNGVRSVAISIDGTKIVSGSKDKTITVWNAVTGSVIATWEGHTNGVRSVAISNDGTKIVSGSDDNTVIVWDAMLESVV
jgi:WD40 repeat protein